MPRRFEVTPLIRAAAVACAITLAAVFVPLATASSAHAAQWSPAASAAEPKVSHAATAAARSAAVNYWTPARMASAKSADALAPHAQSPSTAGAAAAPAASAGVVHKVPPVAGTYRATKAAGPSAGGKASAVASDTIYATPAIGKVFFSIGNVGYACSGSSVNSDSGELVLTAGHCVYDVAAGAWAGNFVYVPGYDGGAPYGIWSAAILTTFAGYTTGDATLDTGFVAVTGPGNLRNTVGAMGLETGYSSFANPLLTMGYPPNSPNWQYYCLATATVSFGDGFVFMPCAQGPGASGSPILDGFDASTGLGNDASDLTLEWTYSDGSHANSGPIFTSQTWSLYESIQGTVV